MIRVSAQYKSSADQDIKVINLEVKMLPLKAENKSIISSALLVTARIAVSQWFLLPE